MFDTHTHFNPSGLYDISENYFQEKLPAFFSVGIHPKAAKNAVFDIVRTLAEKENCLAIGECGFDKFSPFTLKEQEEVFLWQVRLAKLLKKPLIIHCVRLFNEVLRVLKAEKFSQPVIFHGFNANAQTVSQLLKFPKVYFSLSERQLSGNSSVVKSLTEIPLERILLESDTDENTDFKRLTARIAALRGVDGEVIKFYAEENFNEIFFRIKRNYFANVK